MPEPRVILVNNADQETGTAGKMEAHEKGLLHRAVSVFIFNSRNQLLLQRRSASKYHSAGLWTNTTCSHPAPGETTAQAARRRLNEEMGLDCNLKYLFPFSYRTEFENGLTENELDHVFAGHTDENPSPDINEVQDWKWISHDDLLKEIRLNPEAYTTWFKLVWKFVFNSGV
jgi:isopentenyl-diphosphate delta-isomerase